MDLQPLVDHSLAKLQVGIERSVLAAKRELHLPSSDTALKRATEVLSEEAPLFVYRIAITGQQSYDQYDEHPGYAYYQRTETRGFRTPSFCGLARARDLADARMKDLEDAYRGQEGESESTFRPERIALQDHAGRTLQAFDFDETSRTVKWLPIVSMEQAAKLTEEARAMASEASHESRWDNHETARHLSDRARAYIAQATASKLQSRAAP